MPSIENVRPSSKGWGYAFFIIALTAACWIIAYAVHEATFLKPDKPAATTGQR